jgi:hypothetical protein
MRHHHFNHNQPDKRRHCRNLPILIPVREPSFFDISNQNIRASINLPHEPQSTLLITTAVISDMVHEGDKGPGWNRRCQRLRHGKHTALSITNQSKPFAPLCPTDHNCFPIIPPSPVFDRESRLADRCCRRDRRRKTMQIRRKLY